MAAKLPVFRTAILAYLLMWHYRATLARLVWPPVLVLLVAAVVDAFLPSPESVPGKIPSFSSAATLFPLIVTLATVILAIPIKTSAYRLFIGGPGEQLGLRYGRPEWLYIGAVLRVAGRAFLWSLLWFAAAALLAMAVGFVMNAVDVPKWLAAIISAAPGVGGLLVIVWIVSRYYLTPAAAALGRKLALSDSVRLLRGHVRRLIAAYVVAAIPLALVIAGIAFALVPSGISIGNPTGDIPPPGAGVSIVLAVPYAVVWTVGLLLPCAIVGVFCQTVKLDPAEVPVDLPKS